MYTLICSMLFQLATLERKILPNVHTRRLAEPSFFSIVWSHWTMCLNKFIASLFLPVYQWPSKLLSKYASFTFHLTCKHHCSTPSQRAGEEKYLKTKRESPAVLGREYMNQCSERKLWDLLARAGGAECRRLGSCISTFTLGTTNSSSLP